MRILPGDVKKFFYWSALIDHAVLRPLSHIKPNWELGWDEVRRRYRPEEDSFAEDLNTMIARLATLRPPRRYHDHEDRLAEFVRTRMSWNIRKVGKRWVGVDYVSILQEGGFDDVDLADLYLAASGRIHAAIARGQKEFDEMEESHRHMLAAVLSIILYHHYCTPY